MLLIIAHHHDAEAQWLFHLLLKENKLNVMLLMPEALGIDYSISLHLSNNGQHHSTILFKDSGAKLESKNISYAINRLSYIDPIVWKQASTAEKTYATNEINAFFPAFIHSLTCPISNRIHNGALYGEPAFANKWAGNFLQQKLYVHPVMFEPINNFFAFLKHVPSENIFRFLQVGNQLIAPPKQRPAKNYNKLKKVILHNGNEEMQEYIFIESKDNLQLINISKTANLSFYGHRFTNAIYQQIKNTNHDTVDGYTQRNTLALAG